MGRIRWFVLAFAVLAGLILGSGLAMAAEAPFDTNSECLECHDVALGGPAFTKVDFDVGPVDKSTACNKCHWMSGGHAHMPNMQCNSCHYQFPRRAEFYAPAVVTPFGVFSAAASPDTSASALHAIHVNGSWPQTVTPTPGRPIAQNCVSCHAPAACDACHSAPVAHGAHSDTTYTAPAYRVTRGVPVGDTGTDSSFVATVGCARTQCHPPASVRRPVSVEYWDEESAAVSGTWFSYTDSGAFGGDALMSNTIGSAVTFVVQGDGVLRVFGASGSSFGIAEIVVDGVPYYKDCYYIGSVAVGRLLEVPVGPGTHTVVFRVTNMKNPLSGGYWQAVDSVSVRWKGEPVGAFVPTCASCHTTKREVHGYDPAKHQTAASQECVACHEYQNIVDQHAPVVIGAVRGGKTNDGCNICHGGGGWANVRTGRTRECVSCHNATGVGAKTYTPKDPNHYTVARHTATNTTITPGGSCSNCHSLDMKTEHYKPTIAFNLGGYPDKCVACHELKVDAFTSAWNKTCQTQGCHTTKHGDQNARHTSTRTECGGSGCHAIANVVQIHSGPKSSCGTCHKSATQPATTVDCLASGCHAGSSANHHGSHNTTGIIDTGCQGCHFVYLDDEHTKLGYTCDTCHKSNNAAVIAAIAGDQRNCTACHPAVNGRDRHTGQNTMEFVPGNASGHRVYSSLSGMRSSFVVNGSTYTMSLPSASSFLKSGWTTTSLVTCNQCHNFGSSPAGPHGAAVTVNIDPAFSSVKYSNAVLSASSPGLPSGVICAKCHVLKNGSSWSNEAHKEHDDRGFNGGGRCVSCHSSVPHAWRLPRLLAYTTDPAPYRTVSGGLQAIKLRSYSPGNWDKADCYAACDNHHDTMPSPVWPSTAPPAYGALRGKVTNASGAAISGANVSIAGGGGTTTDASGNYTFASVLTGAQQVTVSKSGYVDQTKSATVYKDQTTTLDFTMAAAPPYNNVATGKAATASSQRSGYEAAKAVDGSTSTRWYSSSGGTQWLRIDLGTSYSVDKIVIPWYSSDYAKAYQVQTSTDGSSWTTVYSTSSGSSGTKTHTFSARTARYVRIYCTSSNSSGGYGITELEVWGTIAPVTTGSITGTVRSSTGAAISGATVSVAGGGSTTTASDGSYTLSDVTAGTYTVTASKTGYDSNSKSVTVVAGQSVTADFSLTLVPVATNIAPGKAASASSQRSGYEAAKAVDGSTSTRWYSSNDGTQWLRVDLGAAYSVEKVVIPWYSSYYAKAYKVQTSTDGSSWTDVYSTSNGSSGTKTHTFTTRDARYVRIYCTSANSSSGYSITELEIWGK